MPEGLSGLNAPVLLADHSVPADCGKAGDAEGLASLRHDGVCKAAATEPVRRNRSTEKSPIVHLFNARYVDITAFHKLASCCAKTRLAGASMRRSNSRVPRAWRDCSRSVRRRLR